MSIIKVFAKSRASAIGGAIASIIRDHQRAEVHASGEEAVNRALKAVDLAIDNFKLEGIEPHCVLEFADVTIDDVMRPAIRLNVEAQSSLDRPVLRIDPAGFDFELELENNQE